MTGEELYRRLDYVDSSREKRAAMSDLVLASPSLMAPLLEIAITVNDPISQRACWILEFTAQKNLTYMYPYLDTFTENLPRIHFDASVRPMAKICECLIKAYFSKKAHSAQKTLSETHLERITAACFDWLIGEHKVAAKAYSMTCLLLLGRKFGWIHPELKIILEQNYASGSPAYRARARMTLARIR